MPRDFSPQHRPAPADRLAQATALLKQAAAWLRARAARWNSTTVITIASSAVVLLLLLIIGSRVPVAAYAPQTKHEVLEVSLPDSLDRHHHRPRSRSTTIRSGDSASTALRRLGFSSRDVLAMAAAAKAHYPLTRVHPGQRLVRSSDGATTTVTLDLDPLRFLQLVRKGDGGWHSTIQQRATTSRWVTASGTIHNNFFFDASRAGLDDRTIVNLAYIFGWDIDFARNLRDGDHFSVLLDERFDSSGKPIGTTILAAEFTNRGKTFRAIRFTNRHGETTYYAPDGTSMRKNFLKAPVKFTRISSRFSLARKHPILGYTRAHRGVDYAAPIGTPVHAVGAGTIVYLGRRGGYGRYIKIRHNDHHHATVYGHLHGYARGLHRGSRVKQGQIIGYVGMSGLATGPHLHFEFHVDGRAINPLHVKRTPSEPISRALRAKFNRRAKALLTALRQGTAPKVVAWQ